MAAPIDVPLVSIAKPHVPMEAVDRIDAPVNKVVRTLPRPHIM